MQGASVVCVPWGLWLPCFEACICWQLDRESFNHIVKDAAVARRTKYDEFLKSVNLLSSLEAYERSQIADALVAETCKKGDTIVK